MSQFSMIFTGVLMFLSPAFVAAQDQKNMDQLIQNLGADEYTVRQQATEELKKMGTPALPALEQAAKDTDLERASRAREIITSIKSAQTEKEQAEVRKEPRPDSFHTQDRMSVQIRNDKVRVTIWNSGTGKEETYEADSMEEFKKKYPELADRLGLSIRVERGRSKPARPESPSELERRLKELQRFEEEMDKMFDDEFLKDFGGIGSLDEILRRIQKDREDLHGKRDKQEKKSPSAVRLEAALSPVQDAARKELGLDEGVGARVTSMESGSNAEKCGLRSGDIVVRIDDQVVEGPLDLRRKFSQALERETVRMIVIRGDARQELDFKPADLAD